MRTFDRFVFVLVPLAYVISLRLLAAVGRGLGGRHRRGLISLDDARDNSHYRHQGVNWTVSD